ncbi:dGTPase [Ekhidna lutea]|uniref:dGTPase n=1 Tax=Ekhidna lutea TaxID=447679 RepID=A0A239F5Q6_EKHLU|nr:deoxyguanosinetriphosphate triphosphohydrolase [Ekhidna lutea]SNS52236.1 dGTPase [Ekhidna lutea]
MNWLQLLSHKRPGETKTVAHDQTRSRFEQDYDRIIFSHPFRKLQDKTQVFPLPEDDFVHTRLTHSLEVSVVGRSLAKIAGNYLLEKYPELQEEGYSVNDFGGIVGAACLAHDLGNPPFGHSGEDSISSFFLTNKKGQFFKEKVTSKEWQDLITFEGNAQGLRILNSKGNGGLKLTYATLGAFTKYPISSSCEKEEGRKSQKKFGYYQCNANLFKEMADEMELASNGESKWCRHPLAFLVEAADDICYHIIDLEDGCRLGLVPFETVKELLAEIIGDSYSEEKVQKIASQHERLGTLRAMAIGQLIQECSEAFIANEEAMLTGSFDTDLTSTIPSAKAMDKIIKLSIDKIYRSKLVLEKEAGGYEVIDNLIDAFATSVYAKYFDQPLPKHKSILRLLPEEYEVQLQGVNSVYDALQIVIDFISGLTDSHAVRLYKTIKGYRLPV